MVELIVTVVILAVVISLGGQILYQLTNFFNTSRLRWEIQSAVQLACNKFETNKDSIINAYQADVLYDPQIAEGIVYDETAGTFEWKSGSAGTYVLPSEGAADSEDPYTYIFSTPAYSAESGKYLGSFLFIREFGSENSTLFLAPENMGDIPVEIEFAISYEVEELTTDESGDIQVVNKEYKFLNNSVSIRLQSGLPEVTQFNVDTSFAIPNLSNGSINRKGGALVYEDEWVSGGELAAGPAGWVSFNPDVTVSGIPSSTITYVGDDNSTHTVTATMIERAGNVMRFISPTAFYSKGDVQDLVSSANLASCLTTFAFSENSRQAGRVLGALREFRDNVLAGTAVGDWIIDCYYNEWSPFLVEKLGFLKPVYRAVLIPVSYVCGAIAAVC